MADKIKILFIDVGNGLEVSFAGGNVRLYELIKALVNDGGFDITVFFSPGGHKSFCIYFKNEPEIPASIKTVFIRSSFFLKKNPFVLFLFYSYIISFIHLFIKIGSRNFGNYDIVYSPNDFWYSIIPVKHIKKTGKARIIMADSFHIFPEPKKRPGFFLINWAMYRLQQLSFRMIAGDFDELFILESQAGERISESVKHLGFPHTPHFIKAGMNLDSIKQIKPSEKSFHVVCIGLRVSKGIYDLPDIFQEIVIKIPGIKLGLIGNISEADKSSLINKFKIIGIEKNVTFCGQVGEEEKYAYMKSSKVYAATSHEEGWGIAVGEGMACGLPVVGYSLPAYHSVYKDAPVYIPCFDKKQFAAMIIRLLQEPSFYQEYHKKSLAMAQMYNWKNIFKEELEIFKKDVLRNR